MYTRLITTLHGLNIAYDYLQPGRSNELFLAESEMVSSEKIIIDVEKITQALHFSTLTAELRDDEIDILVSLLTIRSYKAGDIISQPGAPPLADALLILLEGVIEVSARIDKEPMVMLLKTPGELARIISFSGSNMLSIDATIKAKQDCTVLLLERARLEALLDTHHTMVYRIMRGLVRYAHGLARHKSAEAEQMSNYVYRLNGRF